MKTDQWKSRPLLNLTSPLLILGLTLTFSSSAFSSYKPPFERLLQAKARVETAQQIVQALINKVDYGDDEGRGDGDNGRNPSRGTIYSSIPENDPLARRLLVRINVSLEDLAEKMDEATAVYNNNFLFKAKQREVCSRDRLIFQASQGAKGAALLPRAGLLTPADFLPIDDELLAIEDDFGC